MRGIYFIFLFFISCQFGTAQLRYTLLIGNSEYTDGPIRNPVNEVQLHLGKLADCGFKVTAQKHLNARDFTKSAGIFFTKSHMDMALIGKTIRRGSWTLMTSHALSNYKKEPDHKNKTIGFRIAR